MSFVHIISEPRMYADLYAGLLTDLMQVEVIDEPCAEVDVVVLLTHDGSRPRLDQVPSALADAKVIAFSPGAERGQVRLPGENEWQELRPFGLGRLMAEVSSGRALVSTGGSSV